MTDALVAFQRQSGSEPAPTVGAATRPGPEAVAPAFVFFACADSDYITGQVLAVDGGLTV